MTVGDRIRSLRDAAGMTQVELAGRVGLTKQTLYKYENNVVKNIPYALIEKIANELRVSELYLLGWEKGNGSEYSSLEALVINDDALMRRLEKYVKLPQKQKDAILKLIDSM